MKKLQIFQVDAFADQVFKGNPAAIVLVEGELSDDQMQSIATENNLSETAFVTPGGEGFGLRWFTPNMEVDLCGHATLASAYVLFETGLAEGGQVSFETLSGCLKVVREGDWLSMDFPSRKPEPGAPEQHVLVEIDVEILEVNELAEIAPVVVTADDHRTRQRA